jgi:tetratricopeptide (TPR) repeat protein
LAAVRGDLDAAVRLVDRAIDSVTPADAHYVDPFLALKGRLQYARGFQEDAFHVLRDVKGPRQIRVDYCFMPPLYRRAQFEAVAGSPDAEEHLNRALFFATRHDRVERVFEYRTIAPGYRALALARFGRRGEALGSLERFQRLEPERADAAYFAACVFSLLGDKAEALRWLQTAVERGHQELWWARVDPDLEALRGEARFGEILDDWDARLRALLD